jgi:Mn2+/Fe2+ NRAMP family transporter
LTLLPADRPVGVVVAYAVTGALFMPFLAGTLLYMNGRRDWVGALRNGWLATALLVLCLILFGYLGWVELREVVGRLS